ncbi:MAG: type II toxin-antitoxin system HicB family antitoxin [Chloroflexota bacterium]|nr:type II toxin-antitoxin system HicB family antitoxin [Chloroflexota bacterium]
MNKEFYVVIERDEDGFFVGEVPQLQACYAQGTTLDELMTNIREVISLCLEEAIETETLIPDFVGIQKVSI